MEEVFRTSSIKEGLDIRPDMEPEQIWSILSEMADEDIFIEKFNGLEESQRRAVAEHILTRCNIFSEKASFFSSRYNSKSGFME